MVKTLFVSFCLSLFASSCFGQCTFKTGDYIEQLNNPSYVDSINIKVPKSAKWTKNFLKIVRSKSDNIPPSLKKSFFAKIVVNYKFGKCFFDGKVKQNGDWKDHISFKNGEPIRSLNVSMNTGNVSNSIKFKLFIPSTRNNTKEIFGISILSQLGFITPETFKVKVNVNGINSEMIFQESFKKEMLERNKRREGPIFEGDESLLWASGRLYNDEISLSRLVNSNWFLKGESSTDISIEAYRILQKAYISRAINKTGNYIDPNNFLYSYSGENQIFSQYHFVIQALGAEHALISHNRAFYFNSFENSFEPIYYDGNIFKKEFITFSENIIKRSYENFDTKIYSSLIFENSFKDSALKHFKERTNMNVIESEKLFEKYWSIFIINIKKLESKIKDVKFVNKNISLSRSEINSFLNHTSEKRNSDLYGINLKKTHNRKYLIEFLESNENLISNSDLAKLISRNNLIQKRATLITFDSWQKEDLILNTPFLDGNIISSKGINIKIDQINRELIFKQTNPTDWVLITGASIGDWSLYFHGKPKNNNIQQNQRFNSFGMTGCLNFYNSTFDQTEIMMSYGNCEDSLNIVNSNGILSDAIINNSSADSIDVDFSRLSINKIVINHAGNDCLDLSGGSYFIDKAFMTYCGDKGLSVGESSSLLVNSINLKNAPIGISSKDYSIVEIKKTVFNQVDICSEAKQKKQEFGGAIVILEEMHCNGTYISDSNSQIFGNVY
jgi:hypothetical protein